MTEIQQYNPKVTEKKWQQYWDEHDQFKATEQSAKPKYYVLEMFPYPSGRIHIGHVRNYTLGDVVTRYKLSQGFNVLHPMGWDAFGLPAENAAFQNKVHPAIWTDNNIAAMRVQLKSMGLSYDWSREIATCKPEYYGHEQKIFLDFLRNDLVYRKESLVNWDPVENTVLANEQVIDGRGWRSGAHVEKRKLSQWFLKITDYAEELLTAIKDLKSWPEKILTMQTNWIGKSQGAQFKFRIKDWDESIEVYTTRPDTLFGASFVGIAPNHPIAEGLAKTNSAVAAFIEECNASGTSQEEIDKAEKKGIDTGIKVLHPFNSAIELPVYIANFVLMEYGTGAIFGCPAHDARDYEFAKKYQLPILPVIAHSTDDNFYDGDGIMINSEFLDGLTCEDAKIKSIEKLKSLGVGKAKTTYRLRDWGVSRQRYWGCPIPIIHCDGCGAVPVPEDQLPVVAPLDVTFDQPGNPLDHHPTWKHVKCPKCGGEAERETDTFDTFFESSWYFARFCSPHSNEPFEKAAANYWLPVDMYIGGAEHAVMHLLYARFFTKALRDCGYLNIDEPFTGLINQGMVCHETYKDQDGAWLLPEEVKSIKGGYVKIADNSPVIVGRSQKMSKSWKNVIDTDALIDEYGADTARLFMMSDSPPERDLEWTEAGIQGTWKYINRLWRLVNKAQPYLKGNNNVQSDELRNLAHRTIYNANQDFENFHFNKYVARLREFSNAIEKIPDLAKVNTKVLDHAIATLIQMFNPVIPHLTEELWKVIGRKDLTTTPWPVANPEYIVEDTVEIAIQVNGKLRATITVAKDYDTLSLEKVATEQEKVQNFIAGKTIRKIICVPNKIVNIVV